MAKGKYEYWLTEDGLLLLTAWARDGLTDEQIAHNMGVSLTSLKNYRRDFLPILTALKRGKDVIDYAVENALLKKALSGDITAQIFWLKNRKPERWRDKRDIDSQPQNTNTGVVPQLLEALNETRQNAE